MLKLTLAIRQGTLPRGGLMIFGTGATGDGRLDARVAAGFTVDLVKPIDRRATHAPCPPLNRDPCRRRGRVLALDGSG